MNQTKTVPPGQTELAYERRGRAPEILKVLRYTATQVVCQRGGSEVRFNLDDGSERGAHSYGPHVTVVTAATHDAILRGRLEGQLRTSAYNLEELSRKLAQQDCAAMSTDAIEARLNRIKVALITVQGMLTLLPGEER